MSIAIFIGPSLPNNQITDFIKISATILPPIKRGDIASIINSHEIVAIIDGVFHNELSVSPREILLALKKNIKVFGSSSMGALRAAELNKFGMIGVGEIYEMYTNQVITSDGEVALLFDPITYENITTPLVNIRYGIRQATLANIIQPNIASKLLKIAQSIHYTELDYLYLAKKANQYIDNITIDEFINFSVSNRDKIDLKKKDAIKLIEELNSL